MEVPLRHRDGTVETLLRHHRLSNGRDHVGRLDLDRRRRLPCGFGARVVQALLALSTSGLSPIDLFLSVLPRDSRQLEPVEDRFHQLGLVVFSDQRRAQLAEDRLHEARPEIVLGVVPRVEADRDHSPAKEASPIGPGGVDSTQLIGRLAHQPHEKALARPPVAEDPNRERWQHTVGGKDDGKGGCEPRHVELVVASVSLIGTEAGNRRWRRANQVKPPLHAVVVEPAASELVEQFQAQERETHATAHELPVRGRIGSDDE